MQPRTLASGIGLTEGPLWTAAGELLVTSVSRGTLYAVALDGSGARAIADPGGAPSGLAQSADGTLWIAQGGSQLRRDPDREVPPGIQRLGEELAFAARGAFAAPNDLAVGPDGRVWFTDPRGAALHGEPEPGRIWALDGTAELVAEGALYPNGLAFTDDALIVAETATRRLLRYPYDEGALGEPEPFAQLGDGHPDGLAIDAEGNVFVAATTAGAVLVLAPDGSPRERIETGPGSMPTNVCFGASTLFVTVARGGRVLAFERDVHGRQLER